jgi:internalin A
MLDEAPPTLWRRRLRLSVRALMVVVLITGGGLGWLMYRARVQRDAVAAIRRAGGLTYYDWEMRESNTPDFNLLVVNRNGMPKWRKWLIEMIGPDYLGTVRSVTLPGPTNADPIMPYVSQLEDLEELSFRASVPLSNAGIAHLRGLTRLRILRLPSTEPGRITGEGLKHIRGLYRLESLSLQSLPLTDADLTPIRALTNLRVLTGVSPKLTDVGMSNLSALANLRRLDLGWTHITSAGLVHLRDMSQLRYLNLEGTHVNDAGLPTLAALPALTYVRLLYSEVTPVGVANFRKYERGKRMRR